MTSRLTIIIQTNHVRNFPGQGSGLWEGYRARKNAEKRRQLTQNNKTSIAQGFCFSPHSGFSDSSPLFLYVDNCFRLMNFSAAAKFYEVMKVMK